jgi:hypothetical protein
VFRRLLLAVILAASMTLTGVSSCNTGPCAASGEHCKDSDDCCDSITNDAIASCLPALRPEDRYCGRLPTSW